MTKMSWVHLRSERLVNVVKLGRDRRKSEPEKRRMKAAGGGKMVPAKQYKDSKDIGQQRGSQTPELKAGTAGTKGSAKMSAKELQRKAYLERKAREKGWRRCISTI